MNRSDPPAGYVIRENPIGLRDEAGNKLARFQPLRQWDADHVEALYRTNRLDIASFVHRWTAVRFAWNHELHGCQEHLTLHCSVCKPCERCNTLVPPEELEDMSAEGVDWLSCRMCRDAYDRHLERQARA